MSTISAYREPASGVGVADCFVKLHPSGFEPHDCRYQRRDDGSNVIVCIDGVEHVKGDRELVLKLAVPERQVAPVGQSEPEVVDGHSSSYPLVEGAATPDDPSVEQEGGAGVEQPLVAAPPAQPAPRRAKVTWPWDVTRRLDATKPRRAA